MLIETQNVQPEAVQFKYTANRAEYWRVSVGMCDYVIVRGDGDNVAYEWIIVENGHVVRHSDCAYGTDYTALRDGLIAYTD